MSGAYEMEQQSSSAGKEVVSDAMQFGITFIMAMIVYLALTLGSGTAVLFWSTDEVILGIVLSLVVGYFGKRFLFLEAMNTRMLQPKRWGYFIMFLGPFFLAMAKANIDVAKRVITGKINPGIVRITPDLKTDLGVTMLANAITLTPGTLTVDVDEKTNDLFIHWIGVDEEALDGKFCATEPVCGDFPRLIRRFAE